MIQPDFKTTARVICVDVPAPRAPGERHISGTVENMGSSHAMNGFAMDGEPRLAAKQECVALRVFAEPPGRIHGDPGNMSFTGRISHRKYERVVRKLNQISGTEK